MLSEKNVENFDPDEKLRYLIIQETLGDLLAQKNKEILIKEEKRSKYKDLMTSFKEGKVQKENEFWHYFDCNLFVKMSRKDSVYLAENEIGKLNKEIPVLKKEFEEIKKKLIEVLLKENNIQEFDSNIVSLIEEDYIKYLNKK